MVLKGQNVTSGRAKYDIDKTLLKGDALTVFKDNKTSYGSFALANFDKCLDNVMTHVFPEKSVQTQKRCMRHNICLKKGQAIKEWVAQVFE